MNITKHIRTVIFAGISLIGFSADAQILFSTDGQVNPAINGDSNFYWGVGTTTTYMQFTAFGSGLVGSAVVPLLVTDGPGDATAGLYEDNTNNPGTLLLSFARQTSLGSSTFTYIPFSANLSAPVIAGNKYWLGISASGPSTSNNVRWANNGNNNSVTLIQNGGVIFGGASGSFSVSAVPEPSSWLILSFGFVALLCCVRHKSSNA